jgi:tetratricopeptide (TPR) repeat protein
MTGNQDVYQKAMNQGHSAAWERAWDQAAGFYKQALQEMPDNPQALVSLGLALIEMQQFDQALICYRRAMAVTPEDPVPAEKVAQICEQTGKIPDATRAALQAADLFIKSREVDKAIENWERVTRMTPDHMTAHSRMAMTFERMGRKADAVSEYLAVASIMQRSGEVVKATQAVNYALQIQPDSNEARQAIGMIKLGQMLPKPAARSRFSGQLPAAVRQGDSFRLAANTGQSSSAQEPTDEPVADAVKKALIELAATLFEQGEESMDPQPGKRGMSPFIRGSSLSSPEPSERGAALLSLSQAVEAQSHDNYDQAMAELKRAIDMGFNNPAAVFNLGYLYHKLGQIENATTNLRVAVKHPEYALAARLLMGDIFRKTNKLTEASVEFLEALKIADTRTVSAKQADEIRQLYEPLIEAQLQEKDEAAMKELCKNIENQIRRPDWKDQLLKARAQLPAQPEGSPPLPLVEMIQQSQSSRIVDSLGLIRDLGRKNLVRTAIEEAYHALTYAPTYLPLHAQIGEILLQDHQVEGAIQKFQIVADAYNVRGESTQAIVYLQKVIQLNPTELSLRNKLVDLLSAQGRLDDALNEYLSIAEVCVRLAELDTARKTYLNALKVAQQSPSNRAWSIKILNKIVDLDMQRLDWRQAVRVLEQIRTLQPNDEKSRQNLVSLHFRMGNEPVAMTEIDSFISYVENNQQPEKGIIFLQGILEENPKRVEVRKRLAAAYERGGRTHEAITEYDLLGDMLVSVGDRAGAISAIQSIIKLNPPNVEDYKKVLQQM